tara:strand:- start:838 stop:1404 length:567 start_codon:yes stop_codon:yes gene_type:complete
MKNCLILILVFLTISFDLLAAEAGMPQLDPTYWASQIFWLILTFAVLYISISKFYLPKIKKNLDDRESKIKEDLDQAHNLKILSDKKLKEYEMLVENSKKEVAKILFESKNKLDKDLQIKKLEVEKEIENELNRAQEEILELRKSSINSINLISREITSNIIEKLSGDKLNESNIKAIVEDITKKKLR